ncbi:MAG: creatininase family protein [Spirochaetaceae bacterium]|nr:creatininase family protein [Spirochaetaceae bacterium]
MKTEVQYKYLTPEAFLERLTQAPVAYLPLGTLEWHGPHLPLGADGIQAEELFSLLAEDVGGIVLPMLFCAPDIKQVQEDGSELYGMDFYLSEDKNSPYYYNAQQFPGSAYFMEKDLYTQMMFSVVKQLARVGFKVVVMHGHGPANAWAKENTNLLEKQFNVKILTCLSEEDEIGEGYMCDHAAANETMITRHFYPELVKMENLPKEGWIIGTVGQDPRTEATTERAEKIVSFHRKRMTSLIKQILAQL